MLKILFSIKNTRLADLTPIKGLISDSKFKWVGIWNHVLEFEKQLQLVVSISQHSPGEYTNLIYNTNIPKVIYIKYCGENYEEKVINCISKYGKLPEKLRKYLLYDKNDISYIYIYHIKSCSNSDVDNGFLKSIPGGVSSWEHNYIVDKSYNDCSLADLSRHQWKFLDYDLFFHQIRDLSLDLILKRVKYFNKTGNFIPPGGWSYNRIA
tara:strand:+ start:1397 stop:2023 length:627 start_codon:yes stop_codon:yes gene_type:complete